MAYYRSGIQIGYNNIQDKHKQITQQLLEEDKKTKKIIEEVKKENKIIKLKARISCNSVETQSKKKTS